MYIAKYLYRRGHELIQQMFMTRCALRIRHIVMRMKDAVLDNGYESLFTSFSMEPLQIRILFYKCENLIDKYALHEIAGIGYCDMITSIVLPGQFKAGLC